MKLDFVFCIGTVLDAFAKENGKDAEALKAKVATKIVVGLLNSNSDTSKKDCTDGVKDQEKDFGEWGVNHEYVKTAA